MPGDPKTASGLIDERIERVVKLTFFNRCHGRPSLDGGRASR
jgi:hypothetical protein